MNDRGMKKWRPFSSVVPSRELKYAPSSVPLPDLSEGQIEEYEEFLKFSLYTHSSLKVTYIENANIFHMEDYVTRFDQIKKDIYFSKKKLNFRQIVEIER